MGRNPQFPADMVIFTEEIRNGKLHFLCSYTKLRVKVNADSKVRRSLAKAVSK